MTAPLVAGARPSDLVPGSPDRLELLAARCRTMAEGLGGAAGRLRAVDAGEWVGPAGDAFRAVVDVEPGRFEAAAAAFAATGGAVRSYAAVLRDAQADARRAVGLHEESDRVGAAALLEDARERVRQAGDAAARAVAAGWADAPREPRWWESAGNFVAEIGRGAWEATTGMVEFAWTVSPLRAVVNPGGWSRDVTALGEGLAYGVTHPVELGRALVDWDTWKESPGRAIGHLVPDLLLALGTAGAGAAAARGARAAKTLDEVGDIGDVGDVATAFTRLDRAGESGQRLRYLERARQRLLGPDLPAPNLPPRSPAGQAAAFQGNPPYTGVDRWWTARLQPGDEIATGTLSGRQTALGGFAVPRSTADDVGTSATRFYEGVQVEPFKGTYRDELTVLRATRETDVAVGYARANTQFGAGGLRQVFVPDLQDLLEAGHFELVEKRRMTDTVARMGTEVATP